MIIAKDLCAQLTPSIACMHLTASNGATSNNIRGTLPFEISFLSQLSTFILSRGPLSGEFPDWSKLSTLEQVLLNNNHLEGSFPTYLLAQNPLMNIIQFNNNTFEGEFLQDLSSIDSTALTDLSVNGNNFTGPIPSQIDKLSSLSTFLESVYGRCFSFRSSTSNALSFSFAIRNSKCWLEWVHGHPPGRTIHSIHPRYSRPEQHKIARRAIYRRWRLVEIDFLPCQQHPNEWHASDTVVFTDQSLDSGFEFRGFHGITIGATILGLDRSRYRTTEPQ